MNPSHFVRCFLGRKQKDADLALELESHLAHEVDDNLARGMSPEQARRQAYVKLGNPLVIRDKVWEADRVAWLEDFWRDLRYAARTLRKTPSFTCVALLLMALGIGANTSIYSFLDSLLWRSLPVADPGSLVVLNWHTRSMHEPGMDDSVMKSMSGSTYPDARLGVVSGIFPYTAFEIVAQGRRSIFRSVRLRPPPRSAPPEHLDPGPRRDCDRRTRDRRLLQGTPDCTRGGAPDHGRR